MSASTQEVAGAAHSIADSVGTQTRGIGAVAAGSRAHRELVTQHEHAGGPAGVKTGAGGQRDALVADGDRR